MGIHALRAAISGWMEAPLAWLERIPLAAARTALLWPTGPTVNVRGFLFFLVLFAFNLWRGRRSRAQPAAAALDRAGMIEIEGLDVRFGDFPAVQGVSFRVAEGEAFGLVGESGSGKTTVLKAIAGLLADWRGRITVDGAALGHRRSKAFYRQVQMVFQDPYGSLHPRHTVDRTLAEPLAIHGLGDAAARVERALNAVGLDAAFRYRYPHQLSGGQRQRVAIARALMLEPKVLLLDEPTSSLDVSVQAEILNLLSELRAAGRLTYLFVSHNLAVIAHMCERLAVMNRGRIVEEAQTAALASSALADPYSRQLLKSSEGYDRQAAAALVSYD